MTDNKQTISVWSSDLSLVYEAVGENLIASQCNEIEYVLIKMGNITVKISVDTMQCLCNEAAKYTKDPEINEIIENWKTHNSILK